MKQKDILLVVVVAIVAGILSFVIAQFIFGGEKSYKLTAPTVEPISSEFQLPDETYFNKQSLNPTKNITIGDSTNSAPFNSQ
jgi:hypothetical protein